MICKKHGEVGEPLSNGHCIQCEREFIGKDGLEILAVLLDNNNPMKVDDVMKEIGRMVKNKDSGMKQ